MTSKIPSVLCGVQNLVLTWASKVPDAYEVLKKHRKIPESTIARILNPDEIPTEKTFLGYNAIYFESATGVSIFEFIIAQAKIGLWNKIDHLPEIRTHEQLVSVLAKVYKEDPDERFKLLSVRAEFDSRRDLSDNFSGRPLFWKRIPGILEVIALYTKNIEPKGAPKGESAFEVVQKECLHQKLPEIHIDQTGVGCAVNALIAQADLISLLQLNASEVTQVQRISVMRAIVRIAGKFGITQESLDKTRGENPGGAAALEALSHALNVHQKRR